MNLSRNRKRVRTNSYMENPLERGGSLADDGIDLHRGSKKRRVLRKPSDLGTKSMMRITTINSGMEEANRSWGGCRTMGRTLERGEYTISWG